MKVTYKPNEQFVVEVDGTPKEIVEELATSAELFSHKCGKCHGKNGNKLAFRVRKVEDNKYYELHCECGAVLAFGAHKTGGTLFPKRFETTDDGEKKWLPDNGWTKWDKDLGKRV